MQSPTEEPAPSHSGTVASSVRWSAIGKAGVQAVRLAVQLAITRMLVDPHDPEHAAAVLGIIASALLVREFLDLIADFGLGQAVIQRKDLDGAFLRSVLGTNLLIGALASGVLALIAPWIAAWFGEAELIPVLRVLALGFFVGWAGIVHRGLLARSMRFDVIAKADLAAALSVGVVAVPLVAYGFGLWGLVAGLVVSPCVSTAVLWLSSTWRDWPALSFKELRGSLRFVANLLGFNVLNFSTVNLDRVIVGRLGDVAMGHYDWTLRIVMYPVRTVTRTMSGVLTSAFSRLQDDHAAFRARYLRACAGIALVTCPMMFGLAVAAKPLVHTVLGADWLPIVPYLMILAPVGLVQSLTYTTGSIYMAKGRTDWLLRWSLVTVPTLLLAYWLGYPYGVIGVATALCIAYLALALPAFLIPFRLIELPLMTFVRQLAPIVLVAGAMSGVALLTRLALEGTPPLVELLGTVSAGGASYALLLWWLRIPAAGEVLRALRLPERFVRRFQESQA